MKWYSSVENVVVNTSLKTWINMPGNPVEQLPKALLFGVSRLQLGAA